MLEGFFKGLEEPEYIHVLINPLPVLWAGNRTDWPDDRLGGQRFTTVRRVMTA